jgi:hypothetical protein
MVTAAWEKFLEVAPEEMRPLVGDYPIFRDDKTTLPLQAADLAVGNSRPTCGSSLLWAGTGTTALGSRIGYYRAWSLLDQKDELELRTAR